VTAPELSTIVVAWRAADDVAELVAGWPDDRRFELLIVDQDGDLPDRFGDGGRGTRGVAGQRPLALSRQ
jgi:hypothetical protein